MKKEIYEAIAGVVAIIFSLILWFQWLGTMSYTMANGIQVAIVWIIGVVILSIAGTLIGYLGEYFKAAIGLDIEVFDIYDMLGSAVTILFTLILWFVWLSDPVNFTIKGIIETSMLWIVVALIIRFGAIISDWLKLKFGEYLPKPEAVAAKVAKK